MSNKWVVNASPLILLAKVGQIDLLPSLTEELDHALLREALALVGE